MRQAAERLEVSQSTVYALIGAGKLRCNRIGVRRGVIRISEPQIIEYLAGSVPAAPPVVLTPPRLRHFKTS